MSAGTPHSQAQSGSGFLETMVATSRLRAEASVARQRLDRPASPGSTGRLLAALRRPRGTGLAVIAEVKRASPSRGPLAPGIDAAAQARAYELAGADAISVLTEPDRFGGSLGDLRAAVAAVSIPVLRKDFLVHVQQIREAAHAGAAGALLIAAALDDGQLQLLIEECAACGLDALVEVHDESELARVAALDAPLIGINNRDLGTLEVDLATTERLAPLAPAGALVVAESGIDSLQAASRMRAAGAQALLVGAALVRTPQTELPAAIAGLRAADAGRDATMPSSEADS
jgi:indole-3-glycerol phosphate synthase